MNDVVETMKLPLFATLLAEKQGGQEPNTWWLATNLEGTLYLTPISEDERGLDAGRFSKYSKDVLPHEVQVSKPLAAVLDWAGENTSGQWNLVQTPGSKVFTFLASFESASDAGKFSVALEGMSSDEKTMFGWMNFTVEMDDETKRVVSVVAEKVTPG